MQGDHGISSSGIAQAQRLEDGRLVVELSGLRNFSGEICFNLFDGSEGFPDDSGSIVAEQCVNLASTALSNDMPSTDVVIPIVFEDLVAGRSYAVSVLHDEDGDGELDQGSFGIPTEGFGFSKNPEIGMSAPEFHESAVLVLGEMTTSVEMIYF